MKGIAIATRAVLCGVLTIGVTLATACGSNDRPNEARNFGTVTIPLQTTVGANTYRLDAVFVISGAQGDVTLATSGDEPVLSTTLPTGSYSAFLQSFSLSKDDGTGTFNPIAATVVSSTEPFAVFADSTTTVNFQFEAEGTTVSTGSGTVHITFGVTETSGQCTVLGPGCPAGYWCAPPALTGAPAACLPSGTTPIGAACKSPLECVATSTCHDFGAGPVCTSLCSPDQFGQLCATGGSCVEHDPTYGLCTPGDACNPITVDRVARTVQSDNFFLDFGNAVATNPEDLDVLKWTGASLSGSAEDFGPNLTQSFATDACTSGNVTFFGNGLVPPDVDRGGQVLVGAGSAGTWEQDGASIVIHSTSSGCAQSVPVPVETRYTFREGVGADTIEVERTFDFGITPLSQPFRPFVPRLDHGNFDQVLHPDATGTTLVTEAVSNCPYGCQPSNWDGSWFAFYASSGPDAGLGMILLRAPSALPANLWVDYDAGFADTNSSSFLLLPPAGFSQKVTEKELLCFFNAQTWTAVQRASLALPTGCTLDLACDGGGGTGGEGAIHVAPDGDDALALASNGATPFRNVQPAIDFADTHRGLATQVLVAAGPACSATADYPGPSGADLTMRDGISVSGKYESAGWTRCPSSLTRLLPTTGNGVLFGADIKHTSVLDGFEIVSVAADSTAAITVDGAQGVRLVAVTMPQRFAWPEGVQAPTFSYGVLAQANSEITITGSDIFAPPGTAQSLGFESFDAQFVIEDSKLGALAPREAEALLINNTSRGSIVHNTISARVTEDVISAIVAGIAVGADFTNLEISDNDVSVVGNRQWAVGMTLSAFGQTAILARGNHISAEGSGDVTGVTSNGGLTLDSNTIDYSAHGPGRAVGIECGTAYSQFLSSCGKITHNTVESLASPRCDGTCQFDSVGLWVAGAGTLVDGNELHGACGDHPNPEGPPYVPGTSFGIFAGGDVRIENNVAVGGSCVGFPVVRMAGIAISGDFLPNGTIDVHSNWLDGGATTGGGVDTAGIDIRGGSPLIRNNIIRAGSSIIAVNVRQADGQPPQVLDNNDFSPAEPPTAFYLQENGLGFRTVDGVNTLPFANANFDADCEIPLSLGSPCIDAGTPAGAPDHDIDGDPRDPTAPDVGPDEYVVDPRSG